MRQISILFLVLICQIGFGQQSISPQFIQIPTELNAGLTGSACGLRVITHFQNNEFKRLSNSTFYNYGASLDMPIELKNGDKIGIGYSYVGDVAGESSYSNIGHSLSGAYHKHVSLVDGKPTYLSLGLSAGLMKTSIDASGLRWPSQIGPGGFDPTTNPGENYSLSTLYPNVNLGLAFKGQISTSVSTNTGLSIYHLNSPIVSLLGNDTPLKRRLIAYTRLDISLNAKWSINPSFYYTEQGPHNFYMIGTDFTYHINQNKAIAIGGGYGKNKQPYFNASATLHRLSIGLNYGYRQPSFYKMECIVGYLITTNKCP